jgi:phasin
VARYNEACRWTCASTTCVTPTPVSVLEQGSNSQLSASSLDILKRILSVPIPEGVRDLAEKAVVHTRGTFDRSMDALEASVATFERSFDAAGREATAFNRKIIDIARRNVDATFDLATSLAGAKNLADMMELQAAFWRKQFGVLTAQAEEVRALSAKVTADAPEPIKPQMARGAGGRAK